MGGRLKCASSRHCLRYWKYLESRLPGDMPCYQSQWSAWPCYKGRRWGCQHDSPKFGMGWEAMKGKESLDYCWLENPNVWGNWDYVHEDYDTWDKCKNNHDCRKDAYAKIDRMKGGG